MLTDFVSPVPTTCQVQASLLKTLTTFPLFILKESNIAQKGNIFHPGLNS